MVVEPWGGIRKVTLHWGTWEFWGGVPAEGKFMGTLDGGTKKFASKTGFFSDSSLASVAMGGWRVALNVGAGLKENACGPVGEGGAWNVTG